MTLNGARAERKRHRIHTDLVVSMGRMSDLASPNTKRSVAANTLTRKEIAALPSLEIKESHRRSFDRPSTSRFLPCP